ncbi:hypothetical protein NL676_034238 [Syzygium grande]|nr:hypothetical protein NL676_034238 [Syzygium grande]
MTVPDLSYLTNLKELLLTDGEQPKAGWLMMLLNLMTPNIGWITRLPSLETLQLSLSKVTYLPRNFSALTQLRELSLSYMKKLDLTQLPSSSSLWTLRLKHCKIQKPKFSGLKHLSELELDDCDLAEIDGHLLYKKLEGSLSKGHKVPQANSSCPAIGNGIKNLASKPLLKPVGCISKLSTATQLFDHDEKEKTKKKIRSSIHGRCCDNSTVVSHHGPVPSSALLVKFVLNTAFSVAILHFS